MKRMVFIGCYLISMLIFQAVALNAQKIDIQLIDESSLIVEGEVIRQECRYNPEIPDDIQTVNYLVIADILKGDVANRKVAIVTEGGIKDGITQSHSHYPKLTLGEKGIFFLTEQEVKNGVIFHKYDRK